jgi:hypothetical protein
LQSIEIYSFYDKGYIGGHMWEAVNVASIEVTKTEKALSFLNRFRALPFGGILNLLSEGLCPPLQTLNRVRCAQKNIVEVVSVCHGMQ